MKRSACACLAFLSLFLQFYFLLMIQQQSTYMKGLHRIEAEGEIWQKLTKSTIHMRQLTNPVSEKRNCTVPDDWLYPLCAYKVQWLKAFWTNNKACYVERHGMDPKDICSILVFLSEVEAWCPILPWRRHLYELSSNKKRKLDNQVNFRSNTNELFREELNDSKYQFVKDRITRLWPEWRHAAKALEKKSLAVRNRQRKNIFLYMGAYSVRTRWLANAYKGVPLGEMVQWSDLIASLYALGHNITISAELPSMATILNATADNTCGRRLRKKEFDLIFTDYVGSMLIRNKLGPASDHYQCRLRILDSFGTDPGFNYAGHKEGEKFKTDWGKADVHVRQIMTMFPHSPDNLFLGFVVDKDATMETTLSHADQSNKPIGVLYAKDALYLQGRRRYLDVLNKYLEIHATIANERKTSKDAIKTFVPDYVINHGIMKGSDLKKLLRKSKVFIGLTFPYEGPGPLEAIAQGCAFLNPKLNPPLNRENSGFFKGKPTFRALTSQHPYMETFIGKPYVYTTDINDLNLVESTIRKIIAKKVLPFLPYEWTTKGMLERVNMFVEKLNFCEQGEQWPPLKEMRLVMGSKGNSCKEACADNGLLCEPSYFSHIEPFKEFNKSGIFCSRQQRAESLVEPSYKPADQTCISQTMSLLYSCVARDSTRMRLCPCRDYQPQQVAFCRNCGG